MKCQCGRVHAIDLMSPSEREAALNAAVQRAERQCADVIEREVLMLDAPHLSTATLVIVSAGAAVLAQQLRLAASLTAIGAVRMHLGDSQLEATAARAHPLYETARLGVLRKMLERALVAVGNQCGGAVEVATTTEPLPDIDLEKLS